MQVRLVKKLVTINKGKNDEKKFYQFVLVLQNGSQLKIKPNSYTDKDGKATSNYRELSLIADDDLPFDK